MFTGDTIPDNATITQALQALETAMEDVVELSGPGFIALDASDNVYERTWQDSSTIAITNPDGSAGNPSASVVDDSITEPKLSCSNSPTDGYIPKYNSAGTNLTWVGFPVEIGLFLSDAISDLTTGTVDIDFLTPYAFTLTGIMADVSTVPVGAAIVLDVLEEGDKCFINGHFN